MILHVLSKWTWRGLLQRGPMLEDVPHAVHVVLSWRLGSTRGRESDRGRASGGATNYSCDFLTGPKAGDAPPVYTAWRLGREQRGRATIQAEPTGPTRSAPVGKLAGRRMRPL